MDIRPFEYVPAAISARSPNTFYAIKYEDNRNKPYLWKRVRYNGLTTHWVPDRTIYWGTSTKKVNCIGVDDFDVMFAISPSTQPKILQNAGFRYAMSSPHHVSAETETRRNPYVRLFCDSGGFQLISGALDWVDMDELASTYNRCIDYGIGLDIPVPGPLQPKYLMRMCEVMLKNNKYIRSQLKEGVEVYDVSHGRTLKLRQEFLSRVMAQKKKDKLEGGGLAIGGIAQNFQDGGQGQTIINGTVNMVYAMLASKDVYERYHVLGTTGGFFQLMYHLILEHVKDIQITADSTSYIMPATYNLLVTNKLVEHALLSQELPRGLHSITSPCSCPICHHIKYTREFHLSTMANVAHGWHVMAYQRDRIEETARDFLDGRIGLAQAVNTCTADTSSMSKLYLAAAHFVLDAVRKGFKTATEKHGASLRSFMRDGVSKGSLFSGKTKEQKHEREDRLDSILTRYEEFHSKRK